MVFHWSQRVSGTHPRTPRGVISYRVLRMEEDRLSTETLSETLEREAQVRQVSNRL